MLTSLDRRLRVLESTVFVDDLIERYAQHTAQSLTESLAEMDRRCGTGPGVYDPAKFVDRIRSLMRDSIDDPGQHKAALARLRQWQ